MRGLIGNSFRCTQKSGTGDRHDTSVSREHQRSELQSTVQHATRRRSIGMNEVLAVLDQAAVSGANFLATVAVGRWARPAELGIYALGMSIVFILINVQRSLIILPYAVRQNPANDHVRHAGHLLIKSALLSAVVTLALSAFAVISLATHVRARVIILLLVLAWFVPIAILREFIRQICFAHMRLRQVLIIDCAAFLLQTATLVWLGVSQHISAATTFICSGAAFMPIIAIWLYLNRGDLRIDGFRFRESIQQSWGLGGWLLASQLTATVNASVAVWLITVMDGAGPAGVYAACAALASVANPAIAGLNNMLVPRTVLALRREGAEGLKSQIVSDAILLGIVMLGFNVLLACTSTSLITFLYRASYIGHQRVIQAVALASLFSAIGVPAANGLTATEKPRGILWASVCGIAVTGGFGLLLVANYGVAGAAYAVLTGNLVGTAGRWIALLRISRRRQDDDACAVAKVQAVPSQLEPRRDPDWWALRRVDGGSEATIYAAESAADSPRVLAVKLYKPSTSLASARQQFSAIAHLHHAISGRRIDGWTITVPAPIYLSEAPLALVTTMLTGRSLLQHLKSRNCATKSDELTAVAAAIAAALRPVLGARPASWRP